MTFVGFAAFSSSNSNNSTRPAFLENTLKLTPLSYTVAPSGALTPFSTTPASISISGLLRIGLTRLRSLTCCIVVPLPCLLRTTAPSRTTVSRVLRLHCHRLHIPDLRCILRNRAVAGELSRAGNVQDGLVSPSVPVGIQFTQLLVRFEIGLEVRQVHVVVAERQKRVVQLSE